mmetsp:Transcript_17764/g.44789  ORF Transcript_17764/g.44789 Transcript_17764/m.44789 type:complete len:228 (-) Transcript_17764:587-1270(-)
MPSVRACTPCACSNPLRLPPCASWCGGGAAAAPVCLNPWTPHVPAAHCASRQRPMSLLVWWWCCHHYMACVALATMLRQDTLLSQAVLFKARTGQSVIPRACKSCITLRAHVKRGALGDLLPRVPSCAFLRPVACNNCFMAALPCMRTRCPNHLSLCSLSSALAGGCCVSCHSFSLLMLSGPRRRPVMRRRQLLTNTSSRASWLDVRAHDSAAPSKAPQKPHMTTDA